MEKEKNRLVLREGTEEKAEKYFFSYAFPCAQSKLYSGSLSEEDYRFLNKLFLQRKAPDRETFERIFPAAFFRLGKLAKKMNKNKWDLAVLKEYWRNNHNEIVEHGDGMYVWETEEQKDLCKVHEAEIIKKEGEWLIVRYKGKQRKVSGFLVPNAEIGDIVTIHYFHAVEKLG